MAIPTQSFTITARGGLLRELVSKCFIAPAFDPQSPISTHPPLCEFESIWDTGATNCVISPRVVQACNLKPTGMANVHTANGTCVSEVFLINIRLPNGVGFRSVRVTNQPLLGHPVLIGMDVISQGDFTVTNFNRNTKFSFRFPSKAHIDFVEEQKRGGAAPPQVGRNSPCPCGSGKKYKRCHGAT